MFLDVRDLTITLKTGEEIAKDIFFFNRWRRNVVHCGQLWGRKNDGMQGRYGLT